MILYFSFILFFNSLNPDWSSKILKQPNLGLIHSISLEDKKQEEKAEKIIEAWKYYEQRFMKEKNILPLVVSMSLPMVISMAINSLYNIIDSYFIAKINENANIILNIETFILPMDWKIFSNASPSVIIGENKNAREE